MFENIYIAKIKEHFLTEYLMSEYKFANMVAGLPLFDGIVEFFIEKNYLETPEDGVGAEGCWMVVRK